MMPLSGIPTIAFIIRRLRTSNVADTVVLATTTLPADDVVADTASGEGIPVFRGPEEDVLGRYVLAARQFAMQYVVRVTADCPFVHGWTLDYCLQACMQGPPFDLATTKPAFPRGLDYEIYPARVLDDIYMQQQLTDAHREHLTKFIYDFETDKGYRIRRLSPPQELAAVQRTFLIDTKEDYDECVRLLANADSGLERVYELVNDGACA